MSQAKTKSAPAAPKTTKAPAPQTSKGRYAPIKKERTRDETVIFEIIKGGGIICKIKSDKKSKTDSLLSRRDKYI